MTGRDVIKFIQDNKAEDMPIVLLDYEWCQYFKIKKLKITNDIEYTDTNRTKIETASAIEVPCLY